MCMVSAWMEEVEERLAALEPDPALKKRAEKEIPKLRKQAEEALKGLREIAKS